MNILTRLYRRWRLWQGVEPVSIETIDAREDRCRVLFLIRWWATDEDLTAARSKVPLLLREMGMPVKITSVKVIDKE